MRRDRTVELHGPGPVAVTVPQVVQGDGHGGSDRPRLGALGVDEQGSLDLGDEAVRARLRAAAEGVEGGDPDAVVVVPESAQGFPGQQFGIEGGHLEHAVVEGRGGRVTDIGCRQRAEELLRVFGGDVVPVRHGGPP
jgi:hypothetical protein